jgi:putative oxidoreductase
MRRLEPPGFVVGRCLLALLFLHESYAKIMAYDGAVSYSEAYGVPGQLLPAAIALELGGGLLIVAGLATRVAAFLLAGFCVVTAMIFHTNFGESGELLHFEKDLAIAGGFLILCLSGAGPWSLDRVLDASRRQRLNANEPKPHKA